MAACAVAPPAAEAGFFNAELLADAPAVLAPRTPNGLSLCSGNPVYWMFVELDRVAGPAGIGAARFFGTTLVADVDEMLPVEDETGFMAADEAVLASTSIVASPFEFEDACSGVTAAEAEVVEGSFPLA